MIKAADESIPYSYKNDSFLESCGLDYEIFSQNAEFGRGEIVSYNYTYADYDGLTDSYSTNPRYACNIRQMAADKTALIVIDPWKDSPFEEINNSTADHVDKYLMPVVKHAIENDPATIDYTTKIVDDLQKLVDNGNAVLYYYEDYIEPSKFIDEMKNKGIENLIYTGYATHLCLLYRTTGILGIYFADQSPKLSMYVIPEATLAYVTDDDIQNTQMRNNVCTMLSQQEVASVITYSDFLNYTP